MTSKTILFLAIAAVLITGTLSVDQAVFADKDDKKDKDKSKKVQVKTRDSNGDAVKDTTCLVEWRGGDSGPIETNNGGVAKLQVPSEVTAVKVTCGDGETRSSTTADLKDKGTTTIAVIFEAEPESDPFEELWKAIDRIANALRELQDKDMQLMETDADLQSQINDIGTGSQGPPGEDGDDCSILDTDTGADVTCGAETVSISDGEQGPPGATLNHYQVTEVDNESNSVIALCDAGDTLTGGGGFGDGDEAIGSPQSLIGSGPTQQGDQSGWIVLTELNLNKGATATAICADTAEPFR